MWIQGFELSNLSCLGPRDSVLFIKVSLYQGSPHLGVLLLIFVLTTYN